MLKVIIFDLDETLLDWGGRTLSWEDHQRKHLGNVFRYVHDNLYPLPDHEVLFRLTLDKVSEAWKAAKKTLIAPHMGRLLVDVLIQQGVPRHLINADICLTAYDAKLVAGVTVFPDVLPALDNLRRAGLRLGVVTNAIQPMSVRDIELEALGLLPYFVDGCRVSAADVGFLKPHARIFETILDCLGVNPHEVVFVGDNYVADIEGAQQIGIKAVLRERNGALPYKIETPDADIQPDGVIKTLFDLFPLLDEWYPDWEGR